MLGEINLLVFSAKLYDVSFGNVKGVAPTPTPCPGEGGYLQTLYYALCFRTVSLLPFKRRLARLTAVIGFGVSLGALYVAPVNGARLRPLSSAG